MVKVSVITTVYNQERYLKKAIESCLNQSYQDFELIIIDDGSTDNSLEIADSFKDNRIKLLVQDNQGQSKAQIEAIKQATGHYIAWLDGDDKLDRECLRTCVEYLEDNPDTGMVYTDFLEIDESDRLRIDSYRIKQEYSYELLLVNFMVFHFRMVKKSIYDAIGGIREGYNGSEDHDLCLRISEQTKIEQIKKQLYYYRIHKNKYSKNNQLEQIIASQNAIMDAIKRRNLSHKLKLKVEILNSRFSLININ